MYNRNVCYIGTVLLVRMLRRGIGVLGPVAHVPEFAGHHWVVTAVVMIETAMWATMPLRAEELDRRFGLQVQLLTSVSTKLWTVLDEGNLVRGLSLVHKLLLVGSFWILFQELIGFGQHSRGVSPQTAWRTFSSASFVVGRRAFYRWLPSVVDPSPIEEPSTLDGLELEPGCSVDL